MKAPYIGLLLLILSFSFWSWGQKEAFYSVRPGSLHKSGNVTISVLPDKEKFNVQMDYELKKKSLVPVPSKLLKGKTVLEFPKEFRTELGYRNLKTAKTMQIKKAMLKFVKQGTFKEYKNAYFIEVHPTNKKSKIDIIYHPKLPAVGWAQLEITFISHFPVLNGYELKADIE